MGREVFKLLYELMDQQESQQVVKSKVVLEPVPIFRESSARGG
jgi:LacI family transcriptional regulator